MKVDGNQLVPNIELTEDSVGMFGVPLRLHIATQIMAGLAANASPDVFPRAKGAFIMADDLIDFHNKTCEPEVI